ncbi:MAG TPA: ATP-binding protein [Bacteroidota bacterium]|nr:ATP-binding protein [Bacteroidota bacterium]
MTFTIYGFLSLLATMTNLLFGIFVLLENPRSPVNRLWSLTIACLIPWGFGEFIMRTIHDYEAAEIVSRWSGIGFCSIPSFFLHFAIAFCKREDLLHRFMLLPLIYAPAIIFSALQVSGLVTKIIPLWHGFASTPAEAYIYYLAWVEFAFGVGLFLCYQKFKRSTTKHERFQTLFVLLAVIIPLTIGTVNDALFPLFGVETLRISVLSTTLTAGLITFAIVRFQLMALTPQATAGNILQTMGDLLSVLDVQGYIQYANPAFLQMVGFSRPLRGQIHARAFIPNIDAILSEMKMLGTRSEAARSFRVSYKKSGGALIPVSLLISAIIDKGETVGYVLLARDIREELHLQQQLADAARQREEALKLYASSVQRIQEEERQRIARELHDDLCQRLSAVRLELDMVDYDLKQQKRRALKKQLRALKRQVDGMIGDVRKMSTSLRPTVLDDFGLVTALKMLCKEAGRTRKTKVVFQTSDGVSRRYESEVEIALYRIAQEALSNAVKHARASKILVQLKHVDNHVRLIVEDNGKGFYVDDVAQHASTAQGLGLLTMKERAELLGGRYRIETASRKGTRIDVEIPLQNSTKR